jgi:hypothetical protein
MTTAYFSLIMFMKAGKGKGNRLILQPGNIQYVGEQAALCFTSIMTGKKTAGTN